MRKSNHIISKKNFTFDICYTLIMMHNILVSFTTCKLSLEVQTFMLGVAFSAFFIGAICTFQMNYRSIMMCILFVLIGWISYLGSRKMDMLYFAFFLFLCQYVDEDYFWKADLRNRLFLIILLIFLSSLGMIENTVYTKTSLIGFMKYGYGFGFRNPNNFGFFLFLVYIDMVFLAEKGAISNRRLAVGFWILIIMQLLLSASRTPMFLLVLSYLLYLLIKRKPRGFEKASKYSFVFPSCFALLSLFIVQLYKNGNSFVNLINTLTTGRISLWSSFAKEYSVSFLGNAVEYRSASAFLGAVVCDNLYLYLIYNLGLVAAFLWLYSATQYLWNRRCRDAIVVLFMLVLLIYGLVENTMSNVFFFPLILYMSRSLFHTKDMSVAVRRG